jgi:hypothetical protein
VITLAGPLIVVGSLHAAAIVRNRLSRREIDMPAFKKRRAGATFDKISDAPQSLRE